MDEGEQMGEGKQGDESDERRRKMSKRTTLK